MTADCDLEHNYDARFALDRPNDRNTLLKRDYAALSLVPYVQLCGLYTESEIRDRTPGGDVRRRIRANQDERYHKLAAASYSVAPWFGTLPDLYIDCKKVLALPTEQLCSALDSGNIRRIALVPHTYIHDIIHRFYGFLSRVGVPD